MLPATHTHAMLRLSRLALLSVSRECLVQARHDEWHGLVGVVAKEHGGRVVTTHHHDTVVGDAGQQGQHLQLEMFRSSL